ncbi:MAG TPA: metallophosphoesterase, partial [Candidatus Paceibacterota bacterium]|nr:metallophosphoesterase [Candidatus Paceibacterota bacterium]
MKILLTGDWHSTKGIKANICINFLDYAHAYFKENNYDLLIVLGDIFDRSANIKNEAFVPLFMKLYEMHQDGIKMIFILGNHDIYNIDNDSIVETFKPLGKVVKDYEEIEFNGETFGFMPYTKDEDKVNSYPSNIILFTHVPIADFSFDNAFHATEKHAFKRSLFERARLVFTGHFHRHQNWRNIIYVGSPFQQNRGETGQSKGFVTYDTETENWEFVEYNDAPKYVEITTENIPQIKNFDFKNSFVTVRVDRKIKDFAKLKYILYEMGALDIIPIFEHSDETVEINDDEIEVNESIEDVVREVIMSVEDDRI